MASVHLHTLDRRSRHPRPCLSLEVVRGSTAVDVPQVRPAIVRAQTYLSSIDWSTPERLVERMVSDPVAATDWRQLAAGTSIPEGLFIGGERRAAIDGSTRAVNSARDGSTLVKLAWAQPADADAAVAAARAAFDHGPGLGCTHERAARSSSTSPTWSTSIARRSPC